MQRREVSRCLSTFYFASITNDNNVRLSKMGIQKVLLGCLS